ncbi:uncharacterized protein LOC144115220 [Amblyomma americanum]
MPRELFNELLIAEVAKRPLLWDMKDNNFRNRAWKEALWEEVGDALRKNYATVTTEEVMNRWKNLKDTFRKKIKDEADSKRSGAAAGIKSSWPYMQQMEFLRDTVETRRSFCNLAPTDLSVGSAELHMASPVSNEKEPETPLDELEAIFGGPGYTEGSEAGLLPAPTQSTSAVPLRGIKRQKKRQAIQEAERELHSVRNAITSLRPMDASSHFLLSLKPQMDATPPHMLMHLKMELLHVCEQYSQGQYPTDMAVRVPHE